MPRNLRSFVHGSTVVLEWDGPTSAEAPIGYVIEAGSRRGASDLAVIATNGSGRSFTAFGVGSGVYIVRVRSGYRGGVGQASNETVVIVGGGCGSEPSAPGRLAYTVSGSTVTLTWDASGGATSYVLVAGYRSGRADAANADTGNSSTEFVATGVGRGTYYVRLHGKNACGVSGESNEIAVVVR